MTRKDDLERAIAESYDLIRQYEEIIRTSDRPEEKTRARRFIEEQQRLIDAHQAELDALTGDAKPHQPTPQSAAPPKPEGGDEGPGGRMPPFSNTKAINWVVYSLVSFLATSAVLVIFLQPLRCLVEHRITEAKAALIVALASAIGAVLLTLLAGDAKRVLLGLFGGIVASLLLAVMVAILLPPLSEQECTQRKPETVEAPPLTSEAGTTRVREKDGAVMVYVPAGEFWMGSVEEDGGAAPDERPQQRVSLDAFWIDRTEVTNAQYRKCVEAGVCALPEMPKTNTRESYYDNPEYDDYPVVYVTWDQARQYAEWVGGRLPTEAEWEYACRGPEGYAYPWGNRAPNEGVLNYDSPAGDTTPVGLYPTGASWCGALDMGGNVWEWTQSLYVPYPYDPADGRENVDAPGARVLRGGGFRISASLVRCAARREYRPDHSPWEIGFRVCVPVQQD